jgi:hypothetical protein
MELHKGEGRFRSYLDYYHSGLLRAVLENDGDDLLTGDDQQMEVLGATGTDGSNSIAIFLTSTKGQQIAKDTAYHVTGQTASGDGKAMSRWYVGMAINTCLHNNWDPQGSQRVERRWHVQIAAHKQCRIQHGLHRPHSERPPGDFGCPHRLVQGQ